MRMPVRAKMAWRLWPVLSPSADLSSTRVMVPSAVKLLAALSVPSSLNRETRSRELTSMPATVPRVP